MTPRHATRRLRRHLRRAGRPDLQRLVVIGGASRREWVPFLLRPGGSRADVVAVLEVADRLGLNCHEDGGGPDGVTDEWWAYYTATRPARRPDRGAQ